MWQAKNSLRKQDLIDAGKRQVLPLMGVVAKPNNVRRCVRLAECGTLSRDSLSQHFLLGLAADVAGVLNLSQSKAKHVNHSYSYGFRVSAPLCGKGGVLYILKTHLSWVYSWTQN